MLSCSVIRKFVQNFASLQAVENEHDGIYRSQQAFGVIFGNVSAEFVLLGKVDFVQSIRAINVIFTEEFDVNLGCSSARTVPVLAIFVKAPGSEISLIK